MSPPISESTWMVVIGFLSNPGTVRIRFRMFSYLSRRRKIFRSISVLCISNSSMWFKDCLIFTACSGEMTSATADLFLLLEFYICGQ